MPLSSEQISVLRQVTCLITCQVDEGADDQINPALQALVDAMEAAAAVVFWQNGDRLKLRSQAPMGFALDDILQRMQSHQSKKQSMLRELRLARLFTAPTNGRDHR